MLTTLKTQHREIARLTFQGFRAEEIAPKVDMALSTVRGIMADPLFKSYVESLDDRADDDVITTRKRLAEMNPIALDTIESMLSNTDVPANVALRAAESVLDRNGYKPPDRVEHIHGHFTKKDIEDLKQRAKDAKASNSLVIDVEAA